MNMSEDFEPIIVDVPFGHSAMGTVVSEPDDDKGYYERTMQHKISVVPTTAYCPSCSAILEYDSRSGKVKPKWMLQHSDLEFNLSYREDDEGNLYAECDSCGFDLRKDVVQTIENDEGQATEVFRDIVVDNPTYRNGCYYIPVESFIEVAKAFTKGGRLKLCIKQRIGPSVNTYRLDDEAYKDARQFDSSSKGLLGIPKRHWTAAFK